MRQRTLVVRCKEKSIFEFGETSLKDYMHMSRQQRDRLGVGFDRCIVFTDIARRKCCQNDGFFWGRVMA